MSKKKSGGEANSAEPRNPQQCTPPSYSKPVAERVTGEEITVHSYSDYRDTVVMPNRTAQNASLSWAARGLLLFMCSMPPRWRFNERHLLQCSPMGRDHLRSTVRELEAHGYLSRRPLFDAQHRKRGSLWEVRPLPIADQGPHAGEHENPLPGNPSAAPSTGNPSVDRTQSPQGFYPSTGNPSVTPDPLTGFPPTGNPSTEKKHIEENQQQTPLSSSLRSEERPPLPARQESIAVVQDSEQTPPPFIPLHAASEVSRSARKTPQAPVGSTDTSAPLGSPSKGRTAQTKAAAILPAFAEVVRPQLEAWWRLRKQRHGAKAGNELQSRSVNALAFANERGVLEAFADLAAESGWISLGFAGYRDVIDRLAAEQSANDCNDRPNFCMVGGHHGRGTPQRATSRQAEAVDRAIAMFASLDAAPCSTPPISSPFLPA